MGSRQLLALGAIVATLAACKPRVEPTPEPPVPEEGSAPVREVNQTDGLVGTDVEVEAIEVADEGPTAPTILFTAGLKGYTEPCGCTIDLVLGGIDRVTGYVERMQELSPENLVLDVGDTFFEQESLNDIERAQEVRKTEVLVHALTAMGTRATVPGRRDFANGVAFYQELLQGTEIAVLAANLTAGGTAFGPSHIVVEVGGRSVGVVGAVDPTRFEDLAELVATPALPAIQGAAAEAVAAGADTVVLLWQGDIITARQTLSEMTAVDFLLVGHDPRNTDEIEQVGSAYTLEAYDQGRHVGRLKLHCGADAPDGADWENARVGSDEEVARIERVLEGLQEQIATLEAAEGEAPPILARLQEREAGLVAELAAMESAQEPEFPADACRFLFRPIPMDPGLPTLESITEEMRAYNDALRTLNLADAAPPEPAAEGMPHYVGMEVCSTCHVQAADVWHDTAHAGAIETLQERGKEFDRSCIGCHVTGYEQPGGSTLGHTDGLVDVQCEQCHGPGSLHAADPTIRGLPTGVYVERTERTCVGCHNEEHSPRFDYDTYLPRILGPGHGG